MNNRAFDEYISVYELTLSANAEIKAIAYDFEVIHDAFRYYEKVGDKSLLNLQVMKGKIETALETFGSIYTRSLKLFGIGDAPPADANSFFYILLSLPSCSKRSKSQKELREILTKAEGIGCLKKEHLENIESMISAISFSSAENSAHQGVYSAQVYDVLLKNYLQLEDLKASLANNFTQNIDSILKNSYKHHKKKASIDLRVLLVSLVIAYLLYEHSKSVGVYASFELVGKYTCLFLAFGLLFERTRFLAKILGIGLVLWSLVFSMGVEAGKINWSAVFFTIGLVSEISFFGDLFKNQIFGMIDNIRIMKHDADLIITRR